MNEPTFDLDAYRRAQRSRGNLIRLALSLRHKLREALSRPVVSAPARQEENLQATLRAYECRLVQLEIAESKLAADRETVAEAYASLKRHVVQTVRELERRKAETEAAISQSWERHRRRCQHDVASGSCEEERKGLDVRRRELEAFAAYLRRTRRKLSEQEMEVALERLRLAQRISCH